MNVVAHNTFITDNKHIKRLLEQADIIPTKQRLDIARVILSQHQHLSAEQLLMLVNDAGEPVSKATIYNTLKLFAERGVVREVVIDPQRTFYDSNTAPHFHIYNEDTGKLTDTYSECVLPEALPQTPEGTELVGVDLVIRVKNTS